MVFVVLVLDDGDIGCDARIYGPYLDHDAALHGGDAAYHYALAKGYREEGNDFYIFTGIPISSPSGLDDRSRKGRYG